MKTSYSKFLIAIALLTLSFGAIEFFWNNRAPADMKSNTGYMLIVIFAALTIGTHFFLTQSFSSAGSEFIRRFMAATALKFFAYIAVLLIFFIMTSDNKKVLAVHFLAYYFAYTILEVSFLYNASKKTAQD
jgi:hypothetical protein